MGSSSPVVSSSRGGGGGAGGLMMNVRDEHNDSPFPSVFSDVTMEEEEGDGYFFSGSHTSILEYSDDTPSDADSQQQQDHHHHHHGDRHHRRQQQDAGDDSPVRTGRKKKHHRHHEDGRSKFRARRDPPLTADDAILATGSSSPRGGGLVRFLDKDRNSKEHGDDDDEEVVDLVLEESPDAHHSKHGKKDHHHQHHQKGWMKRWTSSFRSPGTSNNTHKQSSSSSHTKASGKRTHRRENSAGMEEYPHFSISTTYQLPLPPASSNSSDSMNGTGGYNDPRGGKASPPTTAPAGPAIPPIFDSPLSSSSFHSKRKSNHNKNAASSSFPPYTEQSRLLSSSTLSSSKQHHVSMSGTHGSMESSSLYHPPPPPSRSIVVAAALLQDYEAGRPPTFSSINVTDATIAMYHFRHSWPAGIARTLATTAFFIASFMEGMMIDDRTTVHESLSSSSSSLHQQHQHKYHQLVATVLNLFAILVFVVDLWTQRDLWKHTTARPPPPEFFLHHNDSSSGSLQRHKRHQHRITRAASLVKPMGLFCLLLGMENMARVVLLQRQNQDSSYGGDDSMVLFSSIFKPLVLFYVSSQARDAFSAIRKILKIVLRVLFMELLLILMFASVACRLFANYDGFESLGSAWLSLFKLATTVVNPSIWMPMYRDTHFAALFFVAFIVVTVFYLHSLVLSVVFQTYIQAAQEIHERNSSDREDAVHLAFQALCQNDADDKEDGELGTKDIEKRHVSIDDVRETLRLMRPHYNSMKINALVSIVDPSHQGMVDFTSFRTKIRQALNASVRTARNASILAMSVELVAVTMAVVNFIYVMLVSSPFSQSWFVNIQLDVGCLITLMGAFELLIRFNPLRVHDFTPLTRINVAFDGSALLAAFISGIGVCMYFAGMPKALEYILIGRSLDIIRALRFFEIFRDVVRRTSDVVPALAGPVILVVSTLHAFVYVGMALWGGAIDVGSYSGLITDLYDLNNFNSYQEGMVTMFQVLVVNDWHAIAEVFQFASRCSSNYIVFPFFISANLFGVSVMLNVLTAFFVESFVTKLHKDVDAPAEDTTTVRKERDFSIQTSGRKKRIASHGSRKKHDVSFDQGTDADSECSSTSQKFEFDVYEREGYDKIMQTVSAAQGLYDGDMARNVCTYLEIFESLTPGREPVGYLICDQRTLERFGNRRFKAKSIGYLDENRLHEVVTDMHAELLALSTKADFDDKSLMRSFQHRRDPSRVLEVSASLLRRQPALSLFVARTYQQQQQQQQPTGRMPPLTAQQHKR